MEEDSIEKYIEWVINKIDYIQEASKAIQKPDVSIHDLKEVLSKRLNVDLVLSSELQRLKAVEKAVKRDYGVFWDEKFTITRRTLNPVTLASGKYASKAEIESETRYSYKETYLEFKKELDDLDNRIAFFRRIMTSWNSVSFDCSNLIKLLEMEIYALSNPSSTETTRRRIR